MTKPQQGYTSGVNRIIAGTIDASGEFIEIVKAESTKNRLVNPDATPAEATNRVTWTSQENVTEFYVWLYPDAETTGTAGWTAAIEDDVSASMVLDSVDYTAGNTLLAASGGAAVDVQIVKLEYNKRNGPYNGTSYFSSVQLDVPVNSKLYVEAQ